MRDVDYRRQPKGFSGTLSPLVPPVRLQDDQPSPKGGGMKYALLIYPEPGSHEALGEDEYKAVNGEYWALREDSRCLGGAHLQPVETATTVRYRAELLRRLGRQEEARAAFEDAMRLAATDPERRFLARRLAGL